MVGAVRTTNGNLSAAQEALRIAEIIGSAQVTALLVTAHVLYEVSCLQATGKS